MCSTYRLCSTQCAALRAPAAATKPYPSAAARWLAWPQLASSPLIDLGSLAAPPAQADNVAHRTDKRDAANPNRRSVHVCSAPNPIPISGHLQEVTRARAGFHSIA